MNTLVLAYAWYEILLVVVSGGIGPRNGTLISAMAKLNTSDTTEVHERSVDTAASNQTLNKLRAAVLGANDGIVSISATIMGVAGATSDSHTILVAGMAALVAGALSMAVGEYVSVSSQSDAEKAYIKREKRLLKQDPEGQFDDLVTTYTDQGISAVTAKQVAKELTEKDALKAHLHAEFGMSEDDVVNPMHAAVASLLSFTLGGSIPFAVMMLVSPELRIIATGVAVIFALCATGYMSATVGGASRSRAMVRVVLGGVAAMVITYYIGTLFGVKV